MSIHPSSFLSLRSRVASLGGAFLVAAAGTVIAQQVDFGKANDYYAARGSGRELVVEQYHLGPGERALRDRNYPKAFSEFLFILKIFPNHPRALALMVQVCEQWKSPRCSGEEFLEKAIAINPGAASTYVAQGIYLHRTRQYSKAIESYKRALEIDPDSLNAEYNIGLTYLETRQYELANEHAQRAYALGAPPSGLRDKLKRAGHWKPIEHTAVPAQQPGTSGSQGAGGRSPEASKK